MANRPHSREKRVSGNSSSVEKHSFSNNKGTSRNFNQRTVHAREERVSSNSASVHKTDFNSSQNRDSNSYGFTTNYGGNKRSSNSFLSKIIRLLIIVMVVYMIFNFISGLFNKPSNNNYYVDNTPTSNYTDADTDTTSSNAYLENHTVTHNSQTSSDAVNYSFTNGARKKYTTILGNNRDEVTVMVYMIGTDLESQYGAATKDINEMLHAQIDDNINVVIQTGGCSRWQNKVFSNRSLERYAITSEGLYQLETNIKNSSMTDSDTLSSFIQYSADNFPANRYMLVLWDHGGGSVSGYGYDENYPKSGSMSPDLIAKALKDGGVKFDLVGFDACLMANLETALAIEPYADYMIGSEETEPGDGWYYTNWLDTLDRNTSIETVDLAKEMIDDYVNYSVMNMRGVEVTQSIVDLGELVYNIKKPLATFSKAAAEKLAGDEYQKIANARGNTKEFSRSAKLDQIDLIDLAKNFDVDGSEELIKAIKSAVKYNKTANITDSYGLSAYFPYSSLSKMNAMVKIYDSIDIDENYANVVKSFASSGQIVTQNSGSSNTSIFDILMGGQSYPSNSFSQSDILDMLTSSYFGDSGYGNSYNNYGSSTNSYSDIFGSGYDSWMDSSMLDMISGFIGRGNLVDTKQLDVVNKNGRNVVSLTDSQWELIESVLLNVFVDDGDGYIDLGLDNIFDWDEEGNLIVESDGTWLSINDHIVPYYMVSDVYIDDNDYKTTGRIPAYLNGQKVDIMVSFTPENPYGIIEGAKLIYTDSDEQQKGLIEIADGDKIQFICNYYEYDGKFIDEYQLGDTFIVNGSMELYNTHLDNKYIYTYCFNDIYGNKLWTPKTEVN